MDYSSKEELITFFIGALGSFVSVLEYVQEYTILHKEDGDFEELLNTLDEFKDIYLKHIMLYKEELGREE